MSAHSSSKPLTVLHLLGTANPEGTGIARVVAALAQGLDPAKYAVHAWFLGPSGPLVDYLQSSGAKALSINWLLGARDPVGAYRFWRSLRASDFAIVHQHFGARSIRRLVSFGSHARLVVHLHGHISERDSLNRVPIAVRGADSVIAVSNSVARQITCMTPTVIYSGVSESFSQRKAELRETVVVGAACRLVPEKGVSELIRAVALLKPDFPQLRLEIAGDGPQRGELEDETVQLGLAGQVRFLGWKHDIRPIFSRWDIFAMPTSCAGEGLPIAVIEAMAEGLPVVATSVPSLSELVQEGDTGCLVEPCNVSSLAEVLKRLILDPNQRLAMGSAGRKRVSQQFSPGRMVAEIAEIYDRLVPCLAM